MASFWLHTALLVPLSALAGAAMLCHRAPDLTSVVTSLETKETVLFDLPRMLEQTAAKQSGGMVEISEGELNDYLQRTLRAVPAGASSAAGQLDRVMVDLEDGKARLHLCWIIFGRPTVASIEFTITKTPKDFTIEVVKGAYGRLEVDRGLLLPLTPALQKLGAAFQPEIEALFKLPQIRIEKNKLVLNPKF